MKLEQIKESVVENGHNHRMHPLFIERDGKLIGMIKRSDFNYLYPVGVDRVEEFDKKQTLHTKELVGYLESIGCKVLIQIAD